MLFEEKPRFYCGPKEDAENSFDYYDRSNRGEINDKRERLNNWLTNINLTEASELVSRMKQNTNEFISGELELILHRMFRKLGYKVTLHPKMENGRAPDFLVKTNKTEFLCEATIVRKSNLTASAEQRKSNLVNAINEIRLPAGYFFSIDFRKIGLNSPNLKSICQEISSAAIEYFDLTAGASFRFDIQRSDWDIELTLFNGGGKIAYDRSIGMHLGRAEFIDSSSDMRERLNKKSTRYGTIRMPLILAIANTKHYDSHDSMIACFFGDEAVSIDLETNIPSLFRLGNGFFGTCESPKNRHVSGVIIFPNALYWAAHIGEKHPTFVPNPWANMPVDHETLPLNSYVVSENGELTKIHGKNFADLIF